MVSRFISLELPINSRSREITFLRIHTIGFGSWLGVFSTRSKEKTGLAISRRRGFHARKQKRTLRHLRLKELQEEPIHVKLIRLDWCAGWRWWCSLSCVARAAVARARARAKSINILGYGTRDEACRLAWSLHVLCVGGTRKKIFSVYGIRCTAF